MFTFFNLR